MHSESTRVVRLVVPCFLLLAFFLVPPTTAKGDQAVSQPLASMVSTSAFPAPILVSQTGQQVLPTNVTTGSGRNVWNLLRSAVVPGWGQLCDGKSIRGIVFMTLWTGISTGMVLQYDDYKKKNDEYNQAILDYQLADFIDVEAKRQAMEEKYDEADKAFQNSRALSAAAIGIWSLSLLDWLIFSPPSPAKTASEATPGNLGLTVQPGRINRIGLRVGF